MTELVTYFNDFLNDIRPTPDQEKECKVGHEKLRENLHAFEGLKDIVIDSFLQGSYARSTAIKPINGKKLDVDIIVVTNLNEKTNTPKAAFDKFIPFLEKYYSGKYEVQDRSWGIKLSSINLDLVITSAPSEIQPYTEIEKGIQKYGSIVEYFSNTKDSMLKSVHLDEEWKEHPLRIPDRGLSKWEDTNPLEQYKWTVYKNRRCNGHYINVVKALKWWRINKYPTQKYPKGYPLESIIGDCCPDGIGSIAKGIVDVTANIVAKFKSNMGSNTMPELKDHGVNNDVLKHLDFTDFKKFYEQIISIVDIARKAYEAKTSKESALLWHEIFGDPFPPKPEDEGFTPREKSTSISKTKFA